tara:strand:- start:765 stop:1304 length:540 start_codon:yes stop_codon:yes gene_type:complete
MNAMTTSNNGFNFKSFTETQKETDTGLNFASLTENITVKAPAFLQNVKEPTNPQTVNVPQQDSYILQLQQNITNEKMINIENKFKILEDNISKLENNNRRCYEIIHTGVYCDNCKKNNITGIRYKCCYCQNYDLCDRCINYSEQIHPENHFMIRILDTNEWNKVQEQLQQEIINKNKIN